LFEVKTVKSFGCGSGLVLVWLLVIEIISS